MELRCINESLNASDADIFIILNKQKVDSTKVAILAGTESSLYVNAPYIQK
jgi:hypothetical protein